MPYANWKNPFEEDDEEPTYWFEEAVNNVGNSLEVFWKDATNKPLNRWMTEQGKMFREPEVKQSKYNPNPYGFSQDFMKQKALADRKFREGQSAYYGVKPPPINSYGLMGSVVPTKPIYTYGLMGSAIRPNLGSLDSIRRWLQAESLKYGSQGTTFPGVTIPQDRSVKVETGYTAPPSTPDYSGYGGYYGYGGGGSYTYKPVPKPWYMNLTNWRI